MNNKTNEFINEQLQLEILISERRRVSFLGIIALIPFFYISITLLFFKSIYSDNYSSLSGLHVYNFIFLIFALREFLIRKKLSQRIAINKPFHESIRYINLFVEASFPSALIMVLLYHWKSVTVLSTPIIFFYIIIIILTILSLDKKLSFFAGAVSAIEFVIILIYILSKYDYPDELAVLNVWYIHGGKALLILLSGILSGIIADQLRKKIYSAFELYGERTRVVNLFSQQVSQQIVDELISQTEELKGKRKFVCVMFLDIRGFTRFAETLEPEEIIEYQNKVFGFMIDIILNNHGIINQFLGDGYMATFGAPISKGNDCENAVRAALSIVEEVNKKSKSGEIPATKIGIGLHAGEVIAGNVGTEARKQYSISGNTVILASRIEELNKKFNSQLLVSGEVINELNGNIESIESFGEVSIKGRAHPISIYKLA